MQAIILAAGIGKRLGELTQNNTKCMVKVCGITLIERMLQQLSELRVSQVVIVTGYKGKELREFLGNSFKDTPICYVDNPIYDKTNNIYSLYLASKHLIVEDTLLLESDLLFEPKVLQRLTANNYPNLTVVAHYESWMDGTVALLDDQDYIVNLLPKQSFSFSDVADYYKTVNIYKFSKEFSTSHFVPFLEA